MCIKIRDHFTSFGRSSNARIVCSNEKRNKIFHHTLPTTRDSSTSLGYKYNGLCGCVQNGRECEYSCLICEAVRLALYVL